MSDSLWPYGLNSPWNCPDQNTGMGSFSLFQGTFPTQRSNPGLPHFRLILYQLSHKGSPKILEWVAYPFSSVSARLSNWTRVFCIVGRSFTNWAIREAPPPFLYNFMYLFTSVLGLHCCMDFSLVGESKGSSLAEVLWFLIALVSLVAEHGF